MVTDPHHNAFTSARVRAGIYCRISRDSEQDGLGVERQQQDCRALAERHDLEVSEVFVDNDISASTSSRKERPAYQRLLTDVRAGRIGVILSYSNSRLTRRPRELEDLIDLNAETGVVIRTVVSGNDDLSTADGRMVARIKANVDAAEAERTAERAARARRQEAEAGRYNGPRPFGYDFATDESGRILTGKHQRLVINAAEARVIKEAVDRVLTGEALWTVKNDFNRRGIPTSTGGQWHSQTLRRTLLRWTHAGFRKHQAYKRGRFVGKAEVHKGGWDAIIDRDTHERVVAILTDPSRRTSRSTEVRHLLTSIAKCGVCDGFLVGTTEYEYEIQGTYVRKDGTRSPSKKRVYPRAYKCPHAGCQKVQRKMDDVDELVSEVVVTLLERDGVQVFGGDRATVESAESRIEAIQAKLALYGDWFSADEITEHEFKRQTASLRPQLATERARLRAAEPADELAEFGGPSARAAWEDAGVATRKRVLRALGNMVGLTITIDPIGSGAYSKSGTSRYAGISVVTNTTPTDKAQSGRP